MAALPLAEPTTMESSLDIISDDILAEYAYLVRVGERGSIREPTWTVTLAQQEHSHRNRKDEYVIKDGLLILDVESLANY
jgi:hypothetical protein